MSSKSKSGKNGKGKRPSKQNKRKGSSKSLLDSKSNLSSASGLPSKEFTASKECLDPSGSFPIQDTSQESPSSSLAGTASPEQVQNAQNEALAVDDSACIETAPMDGRNHVCSDTSSQSLPVLQDPMESLALQTPLPASPLPCPLHVDLGALVELGGTCEEERVSIDDPFPNTTVQDSSIHRSVELDDQPICNLVEETSPQCLTDLLDDWTCPVTAIIPLQFSFAGKHYQVECEFGAGDCTAHTLEKIMERYKIPCHNALSLRKQANAAIVSLQAQQGHYCWINSESDSRSSSHTTLTQMRSIQKCGKAVSLSASELLARARRFASLYNQALATTSGKRASIRSGKSSRYAEPASDADLVEFSLAFETAIHSPVQGLFDAILNLQMRYMKAVSAILVRRNTDVQNLKQHAARSRAQSDAQSDEINSAQHTWRRHLNQVVEKQRQEFHEFIMIVAKHLSAPRSWTFEELISKVFESDMPLHNEQDDDMDDVASSAATHGSLRRKASTELLQLSMNADAKDVESTLDKPEGVPLAVETMNPNVMQIMEMGFTQERAGAALEIARHNVENALSLLLEYPDKIDEHLQVVSKQKKSFATPSTPIRAEEHKSPSRLSTPSRLPNLKAHFESLSLKRPAEQQEQSQWTSKFSNWLGSAMKNTSDHHSPLQASKTPNRMPPSLISPHAPSPSSAAASESFDVYLGSQLKVAYIVTLVQTRTSTWLTLLLMGSDAISTRAQMNIDLFRTLRILVQAYPPGTSLKAVAEMSTIAHISEKVPELVFSNMTAQLAHAQRKMGKAEPVKAPHHDINGETDWIDVQYPQTDAPVYITKHSNLAKVNAVAHLIPPQVMDAAAFSGPSSGSHNSAASSPLRFIRQSPAPAHAPKEADWSSMHPTLAQLRRVLVSVRSGGPIDAVIPATLQASGAPALGHSASVKRIEQVARCVRASLLERARALAAGTALRPDSWALSGLGGASYGGTICFLCRSPEEWSIARAAVLNVFHAT